MSGTDIDFSLPTNPGVMDFLDEMEQVHDEYMALAERNIVAMLNPEDRQRLRELYARTLEMTEVLKNWADSRDS